MEKYLYGDKDYILSKSQVVRKRESESQEVGYIYFLIDEDEIVYIGQTVSIETRILSHLSENTKEFDRFTALRYPRKVLDHCECEYIVHYKPKYNMVLPPNNKYLSKNELKKILGVNGHELNRILRINKIQPSFLERYDVDKVVEGANKID